MIYSINNQELSVKITDFGAEMISVKYRGKERLWQNDDGNWSGHAPILFPFCGNCQMLLQGKDYGSGFHGFVFKQVFAVAQQSESSITFCLTDNAQTLENYPFSFAFYVQYSLKEDTIGITYRIENRSDKTMYYACGAHDSFALPASVEAFALEFPQAESFIYQLHDANGRLSGATEDHGEGKRLPLENRDQSIGDSVILKSLRSRSALLVESANDRCLAQITFPDFSNLLLWHPKNSNMICIEPWQNLPDDADDTQNEFSDKPGVLMLAPRQSGEHHRTIQYF